MVSPAQAAKCASSVDQAALEARILQTELMVTALSCQEHARYNNFVTKFQEELVRRGTDLRHFFNRAYGAQGAQNLNKFVTELANISSNRSLARTDRFCEEVRHAYDAVLAMSPSDLITYAASHPFATSHGIPTCAAQTNTAGTADKRR